MSQIHILNTAGGVLCGRKQTRGYLSLADFNKLTAKQAISKRIKRSVQHSCAYREGGACYVFSGGKRQKATCTIRTRTVSSVCADCSKRAA